MNTKTKADDKQNLKSSHFLHKINSKTATASTAAAEWINRLMSLLAAVTLALMTRMLSMTAGLLTVTRGLGLGLPYVGVHVGLMGLHRPGVHVGLLGLHAAEPKPNAAVPVFKDAN